MSPGKEIKETITTQESSPHASNMTRAKTAPVVITRIDVASVGGHTPSSSALRRVINRTPVQNKINKTMVLPQSNSQPKPLNPKTITVGSKLPTPVDVNTFEKLLEGYPSDKKHYLIQGFSEGFRLGYTGDRCPQTCNNLRTALQQPDIVKEKIQKELAAGRIAGPFDNPPFENLKLSPLGLVPKKKPGEFRLIHHLSYPRGSEESVNSNISKEFSSVKYASIDDAVHHIKRLGKGCFLAKTDLQSAFRIVPLHPDEYNLVGFTWEDKFYHDRCLIMGCSSSCHVFEEVSKALEWIAVNKYGCKHVVHILDDFLFLEESYRKCLESLLGFLKLCNHVGIPIAHEKTFFPLTTLDFVGISLDTIQLEARLPPDKLDKCRALLEEFQGRKSCKLKDLQSLLGFLNFCCSVIVCGRAFLRRLYDLTRGVKQPYYTVRLNTEAQRDIKMWFTFLEKFNGKSMFLEERFLSSSTLTLYTDAAKSLGFGAIYGSFWLYGLFPSSWRDFNITFLELYPIVLAAHIWGHLWKNHSILFYTDNLALVSIINSKTSKESNIMCLVRALVLVCLENNIFFQARHISGCFNVLSDALSRQQVAKFKRLCPNSRERPVEIPPELMPEAFWRALIAS